MENIKDFTWPVSTMTEPEYREFSNMLLKNQEYIANKKIYIFGAGIRGNMFMMYLERHGHLIEGFIDNDMSKVGGWINQYPIISFEDIKKKNLEHLYIIVSIESYEDIKKQLQVINMSENKDFFFLESPLYKIYVKEFFARKRTKYLILGDCLFSQVGLEDSDYTTLGNMLKSKLGKDETKLLSMHGMGMPSFYHMFRLQIKLGMKPELVLLAVNMVMFAGKNNQLPRAQHPVLLETIKQHIEETDGEYNKYVEVARNRFNKFNTDIFTTSQKTHRNRVSDNVIKLHFKMNHMYKLDLENEGIEYLIKIIDLARNNNIKCVPFIPPVNYIKGREIFGEKFANAYEANTSLVKNVLNQKGIEILDLSYICGKAEFACKDTPNELLNDKGRKKEVQQITEYIIKFV